MKEVIGRLVRRRLESQEGTSFCLVFQTRGTSPWPVRNWATQQQVRGRQAGEEAGSVFAATPHCSRCHPSSLLTEQQH